MTVVWFLAGALLIVFLLAEVFEAMVLPRQATRPFRLSRLYYRNAWRAWSGVADLMAHGRRRNTLLRVFGPLSLLTLFVVWAAGLILGFGLVQFSFQPTGADFLDSLYLSGVTFTTLGYGDVTPTGGGRFWAVV